jgi:hypothetical protein
MVMKLFTIAALTVLLTALLATQTILANTSIVTSDQFETLVLNAQTKCPKLNCPDSAIRLEKMNADDIRKLGYQTRDSLKRVGVHMSEILWPDTILEGPFYARFQVRTDRVERVIYKNIQIGWRVTYSDQAWDIETCPFDDQDLNTLATCSTGRIIESSFVNLDFSNEFRDESAYAKFEN